MHKAGLLLVVVYIQVRCVDGAGHATCYVKGSVEAVLPNCTSYFQGRQGTAAELGETERRRVLDAAGALGSKGRRCVCEPVTAIAFFSLHPAAAAVLVGCMLGTGEFTEGGMQLSGTKLCGADCSGRLVCFGCDTHSFLHFVT